MVSNLRTTLSLGPLADDNYKGMVIEGPKSNLLVDLLSLQEPSPCKLAGNDVLAFQLAKQSPWLA